MPPPPAMSRLPYWILPIMLYVLLDLAGLAHHRFQVSADSITDSDTLTRLAYLRQVIETGRWDHGVFAGMNTPYGMILHWSLPFNMLILALVRLFSFSLDLPPEAALHYAGYWTGPVCRVLIAPSGYWVARRLLSPPAAAVAATLMLFSPFLFNYAYNGSANHHALLYLDGVLLVGFGLRALLDSDQPGRGFAFGLFAAFCLWDSPEMVLFAGPLLLAAIWLWIRDGAPRQRSLLLTLGTFSIGAWTALLADPPFGGVGAIWYDQLSAPLAVAADLPLLILLGGLFLPLDGEPRRLAYVLVAGPVAVLLWLALFPSALHGVQIDPYLAREWLAVNREWEPVLQWQRVLLYIGGGGVSLLVASEYRGPREHKELLVFGLGLLCFLATWHFRLAGLLSVASALFLGYWFDNAQRGLERFPPSLTKHARLAAILLCVGPLALELALTASDIRIARWFMGEGAAKHPNCDAYAARTALNDQAWMAAGGGHPRIAADINLAASVVYWTRASTLAGNYHRDNAGLMDAFAFFRDPGESTAHAIAARRGIDFVLICGKARNSGFSFASIANASAAYGRGGEDYEVEDTLYSRLMAGRSPAWLRARKWPPDIRTDLLLYQVIEKDHGT